jgi:hypothetical protein
VKDVFAVHDELSRTIVAILAAYVNKAEVERTLLKLPRDLAGLRPLYDDRRLDSEKPDFISKLSVHHAFLLSSTSEPLSRRCVCQSTAG